ncbi:phage tail tape measure protein [Pseudomonas sp. GD03721]|nr:MULTISPECIES: phage tail tape measure protein [unclassified Pseudomonas]MDH1442064.1 phage tail tape measure protein [Pseudomonas sp. GD03722]WGG02704.1 phage tail tape measure protein [Pseudomonas sp. GD03721]WGG06872.1 phage tail tape measure protein [Pseudomonas sp. GD03919]
MADKFQLKAVITGVDKLSPMLNGVRKNASQLRKQLKASDLGNIGFSDVLQGGAFAAPFVMGAQAAMRFESAMADVRKVVDFDTPAQFEQMGLDVRKLSTELPMAAEGIAQIVAAGGQAGIAREELGRFAEDAVKMGVAFDQTAEQSGEMMAKWRTAFKMTQDGVVELADQINYLGNTGPANTKQISAVVTAIGPLGEVAGLSAAQIAAMGATLAGVGVAQDVAATGMKNFMLTLGAGTAAGKKQQDTFKALRLSAADVAKGMQEDAEGTIKRVLTAVSKVDPTKQAAVLTQLFGKESVAAIAPMLTNLDLLSSNFAKVGDSTAYAGSMNKEYEARAKTTENSLQLLKNRVVDLGISVGAALLPPFNDFMGTIGPVISGVSELAAANTWLVKGILGAAVGFGILRLSVMASTIALGIMNTVAGMSPIGLVVRGIALAAGFLLANWSTVAPYFTAMWEWIKGVFVNGSAQIVGFFTAAGEQIIGALGTVWEMFKTVAGFSPLGLIIANWEPIVAWMKGLWERVQPYIEPIMSAAKWAFGSDEAKPNAGAGPASGPGTTSLSAQAAAVNGANLQGQMVVRFEGAPPGMRVEPAQTNQSGLSVTPQVGYRSLALRQ